MKAIKNIWMLYIMALGLVAICVIAIFILSEESAEQQEENSIAINVAGRQRMLSQRIALFSNVYLNSIRERNEISAASFEDGSCSF